MFSNGLYLIFGFGVYCARGLRTCKSLEKMSAVRVLSSASLSMRHIGTIMGRRTCPPSTRLDSSAHVSQWLGCAIWAGLAGWLLGHTVTSVMYGMGTEAVGAEGPSRPENCEK